jgi:hypothetical protein
MSEKSQLTYKAYSLISLNQCRRAGLSKTYRPHIGSYNLAVSVVTGGECPLASVSENYPVLSCRINPILHLSACGWLAAHMVF